MYLYVTLSIQNLSKYCCEYSNNDYNINKNLETLTTRSSGHNINDINVTWQWKSSNIINAQFCDDLERINIIPIKCLYNITIILLHTFFSLSVPQLCVRESLTKCFFFKFNNFWKSLLHFLWSQIKNIVCNFVKYTYYYVEKVTT